MTTDLASRVQQLEDRNAISERVITYAMAIDRADWDLFASCFTDPVHIDFSDAGLPASDFPRDAFVAFARGGLSGFAARQHLSPNHVIAFDGADLDRAICYSYMYAQHYLPGAEGGDFFLMRGSYTNHMRRARRTVGALRASRNTSAGPRGTRAFPRRPPRASRQSMIRDVVNLSVRSGAPITIRGRVAVEPTPTL